MMPVIVRLWVGSDTLARGGADAGDGVVVVEAAGLAPCVVSVLGLLGSSVYACVFGLLVGAVCRVEGVGPGAGVMEGGVWEVPPCCPSVQGVPAVPWPAGGRVGTGLWLPVGVGWPGGRRSCRPKGTGLQQTSCWGKRGDGVAAVLRRSIRQGGGRMRVATCLLCCFVPRDL